MKMRATLSGGVCWLVLSAIGCGGGPGASGVTIPANISAVSATHDSGDGPEQLEIDKDAFLTCLGTAKSVPTGDVLKCKLKHDYTAVLEGTKNVTIEVHNAKQFTMDDEGFLEAECVYAMLYEAAHKEKPAADTPCGSAPDPTPTASETVPDAPAPEVTSAKPLKPMVGATLTAAQKHDFFGFFQWKEKERKTRADGATDVHFVTSDGSMFKGLITVMVTVDDQDRIMAMQLSMKRAFIDGKQQTFARDVGKSFVTAAAPDAASTLAEALSGEIRDRGRGKTKLPEAPSDAFLAFMGKRPKHELQWPDATMSLSTGDRDGESWLTMRAVPR